LAEVAITVFCCRGLLEQAADHLFACEYSSFENTLLEPDVCAVVEE
jgi:hypothetical protein